MKSLVLKTLFVLAGIVAAGGAASAAEILVNADIAGSETWTSNNTYNLQQQIFVLPGATLTIEAGTIIASTDGLGGSLAVCQGAQIYVQGTKQNPVIMTSKDDVATWVGGDPKTGTWREECNEWGNLTVMGKGYIAEDETPGNVPYPDANNTAIMEGLVEQFPGDPNVIYGGGDDDDNSGKIEFLSIRYGGKVIGLNNELNGLSLGGIGRNTDIHHVEIMNNVDDGVEIWGGCANLSYLAIWNVGDDSLDIDQGFRGTVDNVLIVQGFSTDASQGSGVGDNACEHDGAEDSDWQPVTTTVISNATVIGQPIDGDGLTAWRDSARVQYHNCVFMDCGEKVVRFDNVDGDGAHGYGYNGALSWADCWTTPAGTPPPAHANDPQPPLTWADLYKSQTGGMLCEMTDSVFFNNLNSSAYTEANNVGVFDAANNNVQEPANIPLKEISRATTPLLRGGKLMVPVLSLDPRPAADAMTSADGTYRGAFDPGCPNWIYGWTASQAFGLTPYEPLCFDVKIGSQVLAQLSVIKINGRYSCTLVRNGNAFSDDAPLLPGPGANQYYFKTTNGATFVITAIGGGKFNWDYANGLYAGKLSLVP